MDAETVDYGLWPLVAINAAVFIIFAFSKLARGEEREVLAEFGDEYARYAAATPAFLPRLSFTPYRREAG